MKHKQIILPDNDDSENIWFWGSISKALGGVREQTDRQTDIQTDRQTKIQLYIYRFVPHSMTLHIR